MVWNKWTQEMFEEYVYENFSDEFEVRGEYINNNTKILMYHAICGREFEITPANFKTRKRCSLCNRKDKKTPSQFQEEVAELTKGGYRVLSEYTGAKEKVKMQHVACGHEWDVAPTDFTSGGTRCPKCAGNMKKTTRQFKQNLFNAVGNGYKVTSDYVNDGTPVLFEHSVKECGHRFRMAPSDFIQGQRCPVCAVKGRSGENHYRYNHNLTEEERQKRDMFSGEIKKWRNKIYARDEYTCVICKSLGMKLNAHHLNSWDRHEKERFLLENGVTLCEECHKKFHSTFGYGNNTKEQFNKFRASS